MKRDDISVLRDVSINKKQTLKLAIAQTALSLIIVLFVCVIVGWMLFEAPDLLYMPVPDGNGTMENMRVFPEHGYLFNAARYMSGLLFLVGLGALCVSFFQRFATGRKAGLAATQAGFGVVIIVSCVVISGWGYPTHFTIPTIEGSSLLKSVYIMPGPPETLVIMVTVLSMLLGLGMLGVGIAQIVMAGKQC